MKVVVVLLSLAALGCAKPRVFNNFQDHFKQFMDVSNVLEGAHWRRQQSMGYATYPEFIGKLNELASYDLTEMLAELKKEPEVQEIIQFLNELTIDVDYYVESMQWMIEKLYHNDTEGIPEVELHHRIRRHPMTGRTLTTSQADSVSLLPIRQLRELFNEKMAKNALFRNAIEGIKSDKFKQLYKALWQNKAFLDVADKLAECEFDLKYVFEELLLSLFGQNAPIRITFQILFDEFLNVIVDMESPHWLRQLGGYKGYPEFRKSLAALASTKLVSQYQPLNRNSPAFSTLDRFLKQHDIFVAYWIDRFDFLTEYFHKNDHAIECNEIIEAPESHRSRRHPMTGRTMHTFLVDTVSLLPIRQLRQLFNKKMENDAHFRNAIEGLRSEEFKELYSAIWRDDYWNNLVDELKVKYDLDIKYVIEELAPALYGQNTPVYTSFQTQFDEFMEIIIENAADQFNTLFEAYKQNEKFSASLDTLDNAVFIQLYQDLRKRDVFKNLDSFWKKHDIYVAYYIDRFEFLTRRLNSNVTLVGDIKIKESAALAPSGTTVRDFLADVVDILPKEKLAALYSEKMANNEVFRTAVNALKSTEGKTQYNQLWADRTFQALANAFSAYDFDLRYVFETFVPALYGQ